MKDTHVLCVASIIALVAILSVFIGYATDMLPQHKQRMIITPAATTELSLDIPVEKKKDCPCCQERLKRLREHLEKLREKKKGIKHVESTAD